MSEAAAEKKENPEGSENPEGEATATEIEAPKKGFPMKLVIIIAGAVLILGGGAAGFLYFTSMGRHMIGLDKGESHAAKLPEHIAYYELPEMLVNIQSTEKRRPYLRVMIQLELHNPDDTHGMDLLKPRIIDAIQIYLRELRVEDLEGSAGSQRLKQELLKRVRATAAPIEVADVLFTNFVVQ